MYDANLRQREVYRERKLKGLCVRCGKPHNTGKVRCQTCLDVNSRKIKKERKIQEYALYKGEEFLCMGTAREIAEEMGIKKTTVYFYLSPSYKKRMKKNGKVLIRLDDEED